MSKTTQSRSAIDPILEQIDLESLQMDLKKVAIFFTKPIEIKVPGLKPITAGPKSLGGFHWSIFHRGERCTVCGRCCQKCIVRTWFWAPEDPAPRRLPQIDVKLNGKLMTYRYHMQQDRQFRVACDYLEPVLDNDGFIHLTEEHGIPMMGCSLHGDDSTVTGIRNYDIKPYACAMDLFLNIVGRKLSQFQGEYREYLARRNNGRNWQWPKCPISIVNEPLQDGQLRNDFDHLLQMERNFGHLPYNRFKKGLNLFEKLIRDTERGDLPEGVSLIEGEVL